jgi:hypothetical protein
MEHVVNKNYLKKLILSENGAEALKHVAVLIKYFNIYVCAFVSLDGIQYKMDSTYSKIVSVS